MRRRGSEAVRDHAVIASARTAAHSSLPHRLIVRLGRLAAARLALDGALVEAGRGKPRPYASCFPNPF
jgi:hypothetical protein